MEPLSPEAWELLKQSMDLTSYSEYLKHILTKHDGEAKLAVDLGWVRLTEDKTKSCFWSYQFATDEGV